MESPAITTMVKMREQLPDSTQVQLVEHMREYLADMEDEALWDKQFAHSQPQLIAAVQKARLEIKEGKAQPMDFEWERWIQAINRGKRIA